MTAPGYRALQLLAAVVLVTLMAPSRGRPHQPPQFNTERREVRAPVDNFTLIDQHAKPFEFKNLSGKVVLVSFSYTSCSDVCPLLTASARQVQSGLGPRERHLVHLLTVTTDPEIDSPPILTAYAKRYGVDFANWSFLTGREADLKKVWQNFGVGVKRKGRGLVDHTPLTAIVDRHQQVRYVYVGPTPEPKQMLNDLRALLAAR